MKRRWRWAKKSCRRLPGTTTHPQGNANTDLVARSGRDLRKTMTRGGRPWTEPLVSREVFLNDLCRQNLLLDQISFWTTPAIWRNWRFPRRDGGLGRPACRPGAPRAPRDQQNAQKDSLIADSRPLLKFNVGRVELQPQHKGRTSPCLAASRALSRPRRAQGGRPAVLGALRVSIVVFFGCQELSSRGRRVGVRPVLVFRR